ncbi:DUF5133 domain-containing protein [Streptomyces sp. PRKS01-65]|nr:DUF5133 domain-containing protein [Streptomyces harenosi]NEY33618.1 DUF5133 domain-containing protein [Streptomyces harenosi]
MLMAHPAVLKNLLEQYETLRALHAENGSEEAGRRLDDVTYTLCVSTGTRDVDSALVAARHQMPGARPPAGSLLTT